MANAGICASDVGSIVMLKINRLGTVKFGRHQGAGKANNYNQCAWQILGEGQFFACMQSSKILFG